MQNNIMVAAVVALMVGVVGGYAVSQNRVQINQSTKSQLSYGQGIGLYKSNDVSDNSYRMGYGMMGENQINRENCLAEDCLLVDELEYPVGELPEEVRTALVSALEDEYKAQKTYESVVEKFEFVRPFSMIIRSEESHIASLKAIFDKYGLVIPVNTVSVTASASLQEACQVGVDAEIANAALYREQLIPTVSEFPEIAAVFENLMNVSEYQHLPAFDRCN